MRRSNAAPLLALYVGYLLIATFHPFILSDNSSELTARLLSEVFTFKRPGTKDFAQNVILFIPFGALFYFCLKSAQGSGSVAVISTLAAGCAVSLAIEAGQIFGARHPSLSDVVANSLGSVCGALISTSFPFRVRMALGRFWETLTTSKGFLFCILMFGAAPLILSTVQSPWPNFRTWDSSLPLQIANEATLDRPWLGRIYLVAVYNRAL
jgi:glycopeptide antibiotics resistance protein